MLNPIFWVTGLLLYAYFSKKTNRAKKSLLTALIIIVLFGNKPIAFSIFDWWESDKIEAQELAKSYDHGVILTGNIIRLYETIELYHKGKIKKFFISGFPGDIDYVGTLQKMGIPNEDILKEDESLNTFQSAQAYANLLSEMRAQKKPIPSSLLITSASHMNRSSLCFKKQDIVFDEYRVDFNDYTFRLYDYIIPAASALYCWQRMMHEWIGIMVYKLKGYV